MGNKILYSILFLWVRIHALLPLSVLYVFSDIFYFFIYLIAKYRLKVVRLNMANSFPEKSKKELRQLERDFYHHFCDYIVETIKLGGISLNELKKRAYLVNPELIDTLMDKGHTNVMFVMGHYGNWEWFSGTGSFFKDARVYQIYRPLNNKAFDRLFIYLRTRFDSVGIKKNETVRDMIKLKTAKIRSIVVFLADQTPSKANLHYWTTFLNQETPMLNGPERIATKLNNPVIFAHPRKIKRGYYTVDFKLITDCPKEMPENWITEQYARMMEACILENPAYWLWTHKRWKHKRENEKSSSHNP